MKKTMMLLCSVLMLTGVMPFSFAGEGNMSIIDPWTRPVIIENRPSAAYFTIKNDSHTDDQLISVSSPLADRIELHVHRHEGGVMKMEQVENIPAPAHGTTAVEPGGYHLMLFGLKKKLAIGDELPLVLTFKYAGEIRTTAKVMKKAPKADHSHMDHSKMKH